MRIEDTQTIIEPVTLEEVRRYIGYSEGDISDDDLLTNAISGCRSLLEDLTGMIIAKRVFTAHPEEDGSIGLPPLLNKVTGISYLGIDGIRHDVKDYTVIYGDDPRVSFDIRDEFRDISIAFISGFGIVPRCLKDAILSLCKTAYERGDINSTVSALRPTIQKYWREHL